MLACYGQMDLPGLFLWVILLMLLAPVLIGIVVVMLATGTAAAGSGFSAWLRSLARGTFWGKPLTLFVFAVGVPLSLLALSALLISTVWVDSDFWDTLLFWIALMICGFTTLFLFWGLRNEPMESPQLAKKSRFRDRVHIWLQDMLIASLCFAAGLAILSQFNALHANQSKDFLSWVIYVFVVGALGLLMALDVSSLSQLGRNAVTRGVFFTGIFTLMPVAWPIAAPAWILWRRALASDKPDVPGTRSN